MEAVDKEKEDIQVHKALSYILGKAGYSKLKFGHVFVFAMKDSTSDYLASSVLYVHDIGKTLFRGITDCTTHSELLDTMLEASRLGCTVEDFHGTVILPAHATLDQISIEMDLECASFL